jgi:molybdate transport system substrate-binding protein
VKEAFLSCKGTYEMKMVVQRPLICAIAVVTLLALCGLTSAAQASETVTVFAAASTTNAVADIGKAFEAKGLGKVVTSFASSSTLAKQIENGAPANVFISADEAWMNYLAERKLIDPATRFNIAGNSLVLIAHGDRVVTVKIAPGFDLAKLIGAGRLAVGDPDHVPAGKYAKAALQRLDVWSRVETKLARAANVRAALAFVERGEAPLGIVYSTDAAITPKVKVVGVFPADSHPKIIYPAALVAGKGSAVAKSFLEFLKTPEAKAILKKYGFTAPQ